VASDVRWGGVLSTPPIWSKYAANRRSPSRSRGNPDEPRAPHLRYSASTSV